MINGTRITLIAAHDSQLGIGRRGRIPWHVPADLARFRRLTMGKHVLFGRRTIEGISSPLDGRHIHVLSSSPPAGTSRPGATWHASRESLDRYLMDNGIQELFIAGGQVIYDQLMPLVDRAHLTFIHRDFGCDTHLHALHSMPWTLIYQGVPQMASADLLYSFYTLTA